MCNVGSAQGRNVDQESSMSMLIGDGRHPVLCVCWYWPAEFHGLCTESCPIAEGLEAVCISNKHSELTSPLVLMVMIAYQEYELKCYTSYYVNEHMPNLAGAARSWSG